MPARDRHDLHRHNTDGQRTVNAAAHHQQTTQRQQASTSDHRGTKRQVASNTSTNVSPKNFYIARMYSSHSDPGPTRNKTWLHSEVTEKAIRTALHPIHVIKEATRDISDNVRRTLQFANSDSETDETELRPNVDTERKYTFGEIDSSLLPVNNTFIEVEPKRP